MDDLGGLIKRMYHSGMVLFLGAGLALSSCSKNKNKLNIVQPSIPTASQIVRYDPSDITSNKGIFSSMFSLSNLNDYLEDSWANNEVWISDTIPSTNNPVWFTYELDSTKNIEEVIWVTGEHSRVPIKYEISTSLDGTNYTPQHTETNYAFPNGNNTYPLQQVTNTINTTTKYIKFTITKTKDNWEVGITEFKVYGEE